MSRTAFIIALILFFCLSAQGFAASPDSTPNSPAGKETPVAAPEMADIHDIRGTVAWRPFPESALWLFGAGAILLCAGSLWMFRKEKERVETQEPPVPPDEAALAALSKLHGRIHESAKAFYFELTAILRGWLEGRYAFPALEMTTPELLPRLRTLQVGPDIRQNLERLLRASDSVKFAKGWADPSAMENDLIFVRDFVLMTRYQKEGEPAADSSGAMVIAPDKSVEVQR